MTSNEIRQIFLDFFKTKSHQIVPSAPMVLKNDPTLMFTNAGMNQFKDYFLGNETPKNKRVADSQKCLRVSGKHNDLEEVGIDTYHHTMFEMLGNWSFGDYFKKEAIEWGWELLTDVLKLDKNRLYVTYFGGDESEQLNPDAEARDLWKSLVDESCILPGSKKDNFWEMGDTGPCGPCSEIHVDLRPDSERASVNGATLVNMDHPQVIEIWNLVFIQYNRNASGKLEQLPARHVDTGMGFERLVRAIQQKASNYDTDVFMPLLNEISSLCGIKYGKEEKTDIAMRVIADHLRAVSFAIADGQLPSNAKAGYVIRRILRRAVRYGYSFLGLQAPFMYKLLFTLSDQMGNQFPEIPKQFSLISNVIIEEEKSFLRTLSIGVDKFENYVSKLAGNKSIDGKFAFELYDTYGFPIDLTLLMARERGLDVQIEEFNKFLEEQKNRSRKDATVSAGDWIEIIPDVVTEFTGYDHLSEEVRIARYRSVEQKGKIIFQLVFDKTPFYAESGGQAGDTGWLKSTGENVKIMNTIKENNLIIHLSESLPNDCKASFRAEVDAEKRMETMRNHSATHLLHESLRTVLGTHVEQKGSLVGSDYLRFDFSHFQKLSNNELLQVERMVNEKIRANLVLDEHRSMKQDEALAMGAMALFGEKYGDQVRVIRFGSSVELCGGTHVPSTGTIGFFKIVSESAIAASVRRIEAVTGIKAEELIEKMDEQLRGLKEIFKGKDPVQAVDELNEKLMALQKETEALKKEKLISLAPALLAEAKELNGILFLAKIVDAPTGDLKDIAFGLRNLSENLVAILGSAHGEKAGLTLLISDKLVEDKGWNAGQLIREIAKPIHGGGGGQPFIASAGGTNKDGLNEALNVAEKVFGK
ncbi:MAG: alanine--tRNA ligase [Bacteroidetes bacterium HGW-Bacteroidetes-6]|jgi:alanyl-tRNA synthetase|nr:MAG: alanine--tRNA ligase [Bacteroidetes bacterium HGW-Bacteroidetes-6]